MERDFDFVERPSQDFFCPVSLELLLEPQLTSCCGHHLSLEVTTRLHREGKACPMCNAEQWSAMLDKYHRRKVHEVCVRCWHKDNGCDWVGEVNWWKRHDDSCPKRPWECEYCGLKCMYEEGEGKHWPTCLKFPEPCPNMCDVGSVERCNMEQHLSVCPLEPVACEMKEFGCSVVVPRKELARHMRESELQHLTAMTVMNLRLTRQLQQDSTERDRKIAQLQQEMTDQKKLQTEMANKLANFEMKIDEQKKELTDHIQRAQHATNFIERGGAGSGSEVFTFTQYSKLKENGTAVESTSVYSDPFYSHYHGYKLRLRIQHCFQSSPYKNTIRASVYLIKGEYDDELPWSAQVKIQLELLNQAEDHHHVVGTVTMKLMNDARGGENYVFWTYPVTDHDQMEQSLYMYLGWDQLEQVKMKYGGVVQYVRNDCLTFRIDITIRVGGYTYSTIEGITFTEYSKRKGSGMGVYSDPLHCMNQNPTSSYYDSQKYRNLGYKFKLKLEYHQSPHDDIGVFLCPVEADDELLHQVRGIKVPVEADDELLHQVRGIEVQLYLLNQAVGHYTLLRTEMMNIDWKNDIMRDMAIDSALMKYSDLEKESSSIYYVMNDCLKFRLNITPL